MRLFVAPFSRKLVVPFCYGDKKVLERKGWLLKLQNESDNYYAEASPLQGHSPESWEDVKSFLDGFSLSMHLRKNSADLERLPSLRFALSFLLDPNWKKPGTFPVRTAVVLGISKDSYQLRAQISKAIENGYSTIKLKVNSRNLMEICEITTALVHFSGYKFRIRLDANLLLTAADLENLESYWQCTPSFRECLEFIEEPMSKFWQSEIRQEVHFPVAADESLSQPDLAEFLFSPTQAPDYFVIKPSLVGDLCEIQGLIDKIGSLKKRWLFSSLLESEPGQRQLLQLSSLFPTRFDQGFGIQALFEDSFLQCRAEWDCIPLVLEQEFLNKLPWVEKS